MQGSRDKVVSIAGYDPSGGAGVLADIKTMEAHKVMGLGVNTALTFQNDSEFEGVQWVKTEDIIRQIEILSRRLSFRYIKIGLIESWDALEEIINYLFQLRKHPRIILDPVLKASAGFEFHGEVRQEKLIQVAQKLHFITPNWEEMQQLVPDKAPLEGAKELGQYCHVLLKGGHNSDHPGKDYLITKDKFYAFNAKGKVPYGKHGSGCVLSSALTANLAKGYPLHKACLKAKGYTHKFLNSNLTLLGYHKI